MPKSSPGRGRGRASGAWRLFRPQGCEWQRGRGRGRGRRDEDGVEQEEEGEGGVASATGGGAGSRKWAAAWWMCSGEREKRRSGGRSGEGEGDSGEGGARLQGEGPGEEWAELWQRRFTGVQILEALGRHDDGQRDRSSGTESERQWRLGGGGGGAGGEGRGDGGVTGALGGRRGAGAGRGRWLGGYSSSCRGGLAGVYSCQQPLSTNEREREYK